MECKEALRTVRYWDARTTPYRLAHLMYPSGFFTLLHLLHTFVIHPYHFRTDEMHEFPYASLHLIHLMHRRCIRCIRCKETVWVRMYRASFAGQLFYIRIGTIK